MKYTILSKQTLDEFPITQINEEKKADLVLEMSFSPKLFIQKDISKKVEELVQEGVEWLDARVDYSPSEPKDIEVYDDFRMPYIHQTYKLTNQEKQIGKLNYIDVKSTKFDYSALEDIALEKRLIFKLEEDYGIVFIHESVIQLLQSEIKEVMIRDV